ncbi:MAG TPA: peptide ligase PGM1-related protein [Bacilli bacterium]
MVETFNLIKYLTVDRHKGKIIWLLNIGAEKYWNKANSGVIDRNEDMIVNRVEEMNLLICREQDVIILREKPDEAYLINLQQLGFSIPRILIPESSDLLSPISELILKDDRLLRELARIAMNQEDVYFVPYAVTYLEEQIAENCGLKIIAAPSRVNAMVNDKIFNRAVAETLGLEICKGEVCCTVEEIKQEYDNLVNNAPFFEKIIIKEPYGASGKGLYIVESEDKLSPILTRIARLSRNETNSKWLVEGWYPKKADINFQIYISQEGSVDVFSIKQQILRDTVYIGSKSPADVSEDILNTYKEYGEIIGKYLFQIGYTGVAGIDSIITNEGTIIPVIEINGRFTLSTYISFIGNVLGESKIFSRYFKLILDSPHDYKEICSALDREGILYNAETGEGVLVYTSGTLPLRLDEGSGVYAGRLFTLIASKDWSTVDEYSSRLEALIERKFANSLI